MIAIQDVDNEALDFLRRVMSALDEPIRPRGRECVAASSKRERLGQRALKRDIHIRLSTYPRDARATNVFDDEGFTDRKRALNDLFLGFECVGPTMRKLAPRDLY